MPPSVQTSQKTSGSLGNLHVDNKQENGKTKAGTMHSVSHYFWRPDRGPAGLRKQSQRNKSSFCTVTRPQDPQDQHWNSEDRRYYSGDLQDGSFHFLSVG